MFESREDALFADLPSSPSFNKSHFPDISQSIDRRQNFEDSSSEHVINNSEWFNSDSTAGSSPHASALRDTRESLDTRDKRESLDMRDKRESRDTRDKRESCETSDSLVTFESYGTIASSGLIESRDLMFETCDTWSPPDSTSEVF